MTLILEVSVRITTPSVGPARTVVIEVSNREALPGFPDQDSDEATSVANEVADAAVRLDQLADEVRHKALDQASAFVERFRGTQT